MKKNISEKFSMSEKNLNEKNQDTDTASKGLTALQKPATQLRAPNKIFRGLSMLAQEARIKYFTDVVVT